jgi:hypothetical protein
MKLLAVLLLILPSAAHASPDVVRITVSTGAFAIDHPSARAGDGFSVEMHCESGVDNPIVITNETKLELFVTSPVGLARLSAANEVGPHSATFRSVPRGILGLTVANPHATFVFGCAPN